MAGSSWWHRFSRPASARDQRFIQGTPTPVTRDRIGAYLDAHEYHYQIDDDGDITGLWEGNQLWFLLLGDSQEVLQVRGRWANVLEVPSKLGALRAVNDWNRDRIWPKVYLRAEDSGLTLYVEVSADFEYGATDDQLYQQLDCSIATSTMVLDAVTKTFAPAADDAGN